MAKEFGTLSWFQELDQEDYEAVLSHLRKQVDTIFHTKRIYWSHENTEAFKNLVSSLDNLKLVQLKSSKEIRISYKILFKTTVPLMEKLAGSNGCAGEFKSVFLLKSSRKSLSRTKSLLKRVTPVEKIELFKGLELKNSPALTMLNTKTQFPAVNTRIKSLSDKANEVLLYAVTPEDKFFVEKIATEYLPNIISQAHKMKAVSGFLPSDLESQFMKQLDTISVRLDGISQSVVSKTMQEVAAQTEFLKSIKSNTFEPALLELAKGEK